MPLAAGAAFSIKKRGTDQVSLVFFGDGVLEEGAFYEAINMASLWQLPVVLRVREQRRARASCARAASVRLPRWRQAAHRYLRAPSRFRR